MAIERLLEERSMQSQHYQCPGCGYTYIEKCGDPHVGIPADTPWSDVSENWFCPDCALRDKCEFVPVAVLAGQMEHTSGTMRCSLK